MDDLIKRQDAIGKIKDWMKFIGYSHGERNVMECTIQMLEELPSAIIRCKDCLYYYEPEDELDAWCGAWCGITTEDWFCSLAEDMRGEEE